MLAFFIYILEIALFSLIALVWYRIHYLYNGRELNDHEKIENTVNRLLKGDISDDASYQIKMDSLKKAQIFSGIQLLEIKRDHKNLHQENLKWLREAISLYLIGAIDFIGKQAKCDTKSRKELITLVLKSNLNLSTENTEEYFQEALYRKLSSDNDLMVRAGAKAAKHWLSESIVPKPVSLKARLDDWGVFA
ncbi:MAG: hypothetical protein ACI9T9_001229 [Oleiphilaceae bacterium]|jgi:hypothetical protein